MCWARTHALERGWAIGSWFIPLGNLILPALVVADLHRAEHRRPNHSLLLVVLWWLSWLTTWVWTWLALLFWHPILWWACTGFFVLTAILLAAIIRQVDDRQRAEAQRRHRTLPQPTSVPTWRS
ncbi:DUF4328 domain-containing protein [Nocardia abscessus]|uniref:DUF4328 domain-containing protein n=1 Tax=Nocardia abscessus TaxID=120957 RepID=UPI0024561499|nr:DUF4328 domain-containing protein [Nocardia abscessus]